MNFNLRVGVSAVKVEIRKWLPDMDSNHDKRIQRLLCYHYTIGQTEGQAKVKEWF